MSDIAALHVPPARRRTGRLAAIASPFVVGMVARMGSQLISFVLIVVAARYLSLEAFGVYTLAASSAVIATAFVFTGVYHAILRSSDLAAQADTLFWLQAATGLAGALCILAVALAFGGLSTEFGTALLVAAPLPVLSVPTAWNEALLLRKARARAASLYVLVSEAIGLAAAIWMLRQGMGIFALLGGRYAVALVSLVLTVALVRRCPRLSLRRDQIRSAGATALPIWGTTGIGMFSNYGADFVLAGFLSPTAVGAYRSGARIATTAADVIFQPMRMLSWSRFSRLEQDGDTQGITEAWTVNMAFCCAVLWPAMTGVGLIAEDLVVTILDPGWAAAAPILAILCLGRALSVPQIMLDPLLICLGRSALQVKLRLAGGVLLLAALLLAGRHGAQEAAWAVTFTMAVTGFAGLVAIAAVLKLRARQIVRAFAPSACLAGFVGLSVPALASTVAGMPPATAVAVQIAVGLAVWGTGIAAMMRLGLLRMPTP